MRDLKRTRVDEWVYIFVDEIVSVETLYVSEEWIGSELRMFRDEVVEESFFGRVVGKYVLDVEDEYDVEWIFLEANSFVTLLVLWELIGDTKEEFKDLAEGFHYITEILLVSDTFSNLFSQVFLLDLIFDIDAIHICEHFILPSLQISVYEWERF